MHFIQKYVNDARLLYKALNGVFVIHKPEVEHFETVRATIISNLCRDLNEMNQRPPNKYISIEGKTNKEMKVLVRNSYADHPLVVGPRYQTTDFRMSGAYLMQRDSCGVLVLGINNGNRTIMKLREASSTKYYRVKGLLGQATDNYFHTGRIKERSTYAHVKRGHLDKLCSSMQSSHQRKMFELCGVDIQSQTAYELAVKGLLRPADRNIPMIYSIKCIDFSPPEFILEISCINENEMYLKTLIHDLGMQLRSTATCTKILCIQDGLFNMNHSLLKKHWNLERILGSIAECRKIINENKYLINQESPTLIEPDADKSNENVSTM